MKMFAKLQCTCSGCDSIVSNYAKECPKCNMQLTWNTKNKLFQTLEGHTIDALRILMAYIETNSDVIEQFCQRWQLNKQSFLKSLFLTVYFHDIGKLTKQFQENIRTGKSSQKYPHAFYGQIILNEIDFPNMLEMPIEKAAILGHHTQLWSQIYAGDEEFNKPSFHEEDIKAFVISSKDVYIELGYDKYFLFDGITIDSLPESRKFWGILRDYRNDLISEISSFDDKEKLKSIFCYVFSILEFCDDYSSAEFSEFTKDYRGGDREFGSVMKEPTKYLPRLYVDNPYEKVLGKNTPYTYQKDERGNLCDDVPFFGLLFAPCGRGKTETSLIWALKAIKKYRRNKIIFAMPTQITSNAMWKRFCELFGAENVGLFHGKSFIKLKGDKEREKEEEDDLTAEDLNEIRGENFKGNVFFKPITVTTIDHLIYSFVHGFSQADFALGNLQNAIVVFDEVHYYEKNPNQNKSTLDHIATLLRVLEKMKIPNLLMSGTLPDFFVSDVKRINPAYEGPFIDNEGLSFEPFKLKIFKKSIVTKDGVNNELIREIAENYSKGLIQFIILNTIERSKLVYDALIAKLPQNEGNIKVVLHHSQFTHKDRADKERNILHMLKDEKSRPFILVATQVIEISLDISCDVMYTELAPADALGQRGGRLNRKGKTWISKGLEHTMNIFMPEEFGSETPQKRPYDLELLKKTIEIVEDGPCSYRKLKCMCDGVYMNYKLVTPTNLRTVFRECCLFGYKPFDITFDDEEKGRIIQIRSDENQTLDVIPWDYYLGDERKLTVENQAKIPLWWYKQDEKEHGVAQYFEKIPVKVGRKEKYYWVTRLQYSKERGFERKGFTNQSNSFSNIL